MDRGDAALIGGFAEARIFIGNVHDCEFMRSTFVIEKASCLWVGHDMERHLCRAEIER